MCASRLTKSWRPPERNDSVLKHDADTQTIHNGGGTSGRQLLVCAGMSECDLQSSPFTSIKSGQENETTLLLKNDDAEYVEKMGL